MASKGAEGAQQPTKGTSDALLSPPENSVTDEWDEARIEKSLDTLKEMYIQLRNIRTTIPRMIAPLAKRQTSPSTISQEFSAASNAAVQEIHDFRALMNDPATLQILEHARKSRAERPEGISPWKISDHPGWSSKGH